MVKKTEKLNKAGESVYSPLTKQQLIHAIKRNFDGFHQHQFDATEIFLTETNISDSVEGTNTLSEEEKKVQTLCFVYIHALIYLKFVSSLLCMQF